MYSCCRKGRLNSRCARRKRGRYRHEVSRQESDDSQSIFQSVCAVRRYVAGSGLVGAREGAMRPASLELRRVRLCVRDDGLFRAASRADYRRRRLKSASFHAYGAFNRLDFEIQRRRARIVGLGIKDRTRIRAMAGRGMQRALFLPGSMKQMCHAASMRIVFAPSQRTDLQRSGRRSRPDVIVMKWLPASCPTLLAKRTPP